jgi:hypothetical protein
MESDRLMWTPHQPVPVEATFDAFITRAGGRRVVTLLKEPPNFENADYVFAEAAVIAELKEVTTDFAKAKGFREKHLALALDHVSQGKLTVRQVLGADRLSGDFVAAFVRLFRPALTRIVKKANTQIKSTKQHLGWTDASGVLFLVNDGFPSLEPAFVQALVSDILTSSYSSVDCFVYMTLNTSVELPGSDLANLLWVPTYSPTAPDELVSFVDDLGKIWGEFLDEVLGPTEARTATSERSILSGSRAIPRQKKVE